MSNKNEAANKLIDRMVFKAGCGGLIEVQIGDIRFNARCDYISYGGDKLTEPAHIEMNLSTYMNGVKFVADPVTDHDDQKNKEIRKLRERLGKVGAAKAGLERELQIALQALHCGTSAKQLQEDLSWLEKQHAEVFSKVKTLEEQLEVARCENARLEGYSDQIDWKYKRLALAYADLSGRKARLEIDNAKLRHEKPNQFVGSVSSTTKHWYESASVMWTLGLLFGAVSGVVATVICLG